MKEKQRLLAKKVQVCQLKFLYAVICRLLWKCDLLQ